MLRVAKPQLIHISPVASWQCIWNSNQMVTGSTPCGSTAVLGLLFPPELFVSLRNHLKFLIFFVKFIITFLSASRQLQNYYNRSIYLYYLCPIFCQFLKYIKGIFFLFLKFVSGQVITDISMPTNLLIPPSLQIKTTGEQLSYYWKKDNKTFGHQI